MLHGDERWQELLRCEGLDQAHAIATSIEAMEYDVRVIDLVTGRPVSGDATDVDPAGRFVIETRPEDEAELSEVLDQIVAEQDDFDDYLDRRDNKTLSVRRVLLGTLIAIVAVLAMLGIIEI